MIWKVKVEKLFQWIKMDLVQKYFKLEEIDIEL